MSDSAQTISGMGEGATAVQVNGSHVVVSIGGAQKLHLTRPAQYRDRKHSNALLHLMSPFSASTPLLNRDEDLKSFITWCKNGAPFSIRVLAGGAGAGKTRFAVELLKALGAEVESAAPSSWCGGFLDLQNRLALGDLGGLSKLRWQRPTLIVVDYAATADSLLVPWLDQLATALNEESAPVRVLLLDRIANAKVGWLSQLYQFKGYSEADLSAYLDAADVGLPFHQLAPMDDLSDRRLLLQKALELVAKVEGVPAPPLPAIGTDLDFERRLAQNDPHQIPWTDPLYLILAAAVAIQYGVPTALAMNRLELASALAQREHHRLHRNAASASIRQLRSLVAACATMVRGLDGQQADQIINVILQTTGLHHPEGPAALRSEVFLHLPGEDGGIASISPDIIGEAFAYFGFTNGSPPPRKEQVQTILLELLHTKPSSILEVLMLLIQDYSLGWKSNNDPQLGTMSSAYEPIDWLTDLAKHGREEDVEVLGQIFFALPANTLVLRERRVEIGESFLSLMEAVTDGKHTDVLTSNLKAAVLNNHAGFLGDLGRLDEALERAREAVAIYRVLTEAHPDPFTSDLATSLNCLAIRYSDLGLKKEALESAQEALVIRRNLAETNPETFTADLAMSLNNLSNYLSDLGLREEALESAHEALVIRRERAETNPNTFASDLAMTLNNFANRLGELGHWKEAIPYALEALNLYRSLSVGRPDTFKPDFAMSLNNYAAYLSKSGQSEKALQCVQEAVTITRELVKKHPDVFKPDLALSLNNLASVLGELGLREEALKYAQEATMIRRDLAAERPAAFKPNLAASLRTLALYLRFSGRPEEGLDCANEALEIYRTLAATQLNPCAPEVAMSLHNLANCLGEMGRWEEALECAEEAVSIFRVLAMSRPSASAPDLALSLGVLQACQAAVEQVSSARDTAELGISVLLPYFNSCPILHAEVMARLCRAYIENSEKLGKVPDHALLQPIFEVLQILSESASVREVE